MKKFVMGAVLLAIGGFVFASEVPPTDYTCVRTTKTGFNVLNIQYSQYGGKQPFILFGETPNGLDYYRYDSIDDLKGGVYDMQRQSIISISSDNSNYPLKVHYKDADKKLEYSCKLDDEQTARDLDSWKIEHPTKQERAKQYAEAKAEAQKAAQKKVLAAQTAAEKKAADGVDDLLSGLTPPRQPKSSKPVYGGASGADLSRYVNGIATTIRMHIDISKYKGKACELHLHLDSNGEVKGVDGLSGDGDLCSDAMAAIYTIDNFQRPPSEAIANIMKDAFINFRL